MLVLTIGIAVFMMFKPSKKKAGDGPGFEFNEETMFGIGTLAHHTMYVKARCEPSSMRPPIEDI